MERGAYNVERTGEQIKSFKDLRVWNEGHKLVIMIYKMTSSFPKEETFGLVSQMRRAAVSITSNIAEGFSRNSYKEKVQFYAVAQGSVTELQNQALIARDVGYLSTGEYEDAQQQSVVVHKMVHGLMKGARSFGVKRNS